jgi:C4-dicarboxylate-specific signal transduction histidine kinase
MQVLINLFTNAKDALGSRAKGDKRLTVRLLPDGDENFVIEVEDNGCGVDSADRERIFANGFTTKRNGRGYGLHFCALAATEMGGTISVASKGAGLGATFALRLPLSKLAEVQV